MALGYANVVPVVAQYGNALAGKVIVDICNPVNSAADGLATPDATSSAQEVANAAPASASVVKAFNTTFGAVLAKGQPLDVFIAGDDERAKAAVAEFIDSLKLRPLDVGGLTMAHYLEGTGLVMIGLAQHGVGNFDFALSSPCPTEPHRRRATPCTNRSAMPPKSWSVDHRRIRMPDVSVSRRGLSAFYRGRGGFAGCGIDAANGCLRNVPHPLTKCLI